MPINHSHSCEKEASEDLLQEKAADLIDNILNIDEEYGENSHEFSALGPVDFF